MLSTDDSNSMNCFNSQTKKCEGGCTANSLTIRHPDGSMGVYMHRPYLSINVNAGKRVHRGGSIAKVGNVGCASDPHL